jgi:AraC family transcriptional regulator, regulatory protein of adaptative response / methylphosphotriester-DNA alkyltransferase methyltransferase
MAIRSTTVARRRALYEEAAVIIEREYASDMELDAVARRLATSRRQLQRAFAEAGKTSFRTHLAEVRMRKALELLQEGSLAVRDVATSVGYRQAAQFAKTFRRHHGRPPSSVRREAQAAGARRTDGDQPQVHPLSAPGLSRSAQAAA